jgi:hypothetical protein
MKNSTTKVIFLLLAFVFPVCIFVFLKLFGRNEFDVPPLFATEAPPLNEGCDFKPSLPYFVPDSIQTRYQLPADSLTVIFFGPLSGEALNQIDRIREQTGSDPVQVIASMDTQETTNITDPEANIQKGADATVFNSREIPETPSAQRAMDTESARHCIFFLGNGLDVVMLDSRGAIRGQYTASDREDMDRLLTEITIILKKY